MSAKGYSLHVGLNAVSPDTYGGWSGPLTACEADAWDMARICEGAGCDSRVLPTEMATWGAVAMWISEAARQAAAGDFVCITYSGHGGQVPDTNGDEVDGWDETWCLFDRELIDDELRALLTLFAPGVRVLVLSDSCHSGTMTKLAPMTRPRRARGLPTAAGVLLISGCQDNQLSDDGAKNGAFTGALLKVWDGGRFEGNYRKFYKAIRAELPDWQRPNLFRTGAHNPTFDRQRPFTV